MFYFVLKISFIYLWEEKLKWEERWEGEQENPQQTLCWAGAPSFDPEIMIWAEIKSPTCIQLSHAGAPGFLLFLNRLLGQCGALGRAFNSPPEWR